MRLVIQRVTYGSVSVENELTGEISNGLVVLLGVTHNDSIAEADFLVEKLINLRIFEDSEGKMNLSLLDTQGELLIISQFTLYGDAKKGRRPNFTDAAKPEKAEELYNYFVKVAEEKVSKVQTGIFGAHMDVKIHNNGPVTLILDK